MSKQKDSCVIAPMIGDERSELYMGLLKKCKSRPLANWIYASYKAGKIGELMDNARTTSGEEKYHRNAQKEHSAKDVCDFIEWDSMAKDLMHISDLEEELGTIDKATGKRKVFTDAKEALKIADKFNSTPSHRGIVANVYKYGKNNYNVVLSEKDSRTHTSVTTVKKRLIAWDIYKQIFNSVGIDLDSIDYPEEIADTFSAFNSGLIVELVGLQNAHPRYMNKIDALKLFYANVNIPQVRALVGNGAFSSLEEAAQAVYDINHRQGSYTSHQKILIREAILESKKFQEINLQAVKEQINRVTNEMLEQNEEETIRKELHKLNKKYGIDIEEIHKTSNDIKSLSDAAVEAVFIIRREIRRIEKQKGVTEESKKLEQVLGRLMSELQYKKYYSGLLSVVEEAAKEIESIDEMFINAPIKPTILENAFEKAKICYKVNKIIEKYYNLIDSLSKDNLLIDESISEFDTKRLREQAQKLKSILDAQAGKVKEKSKSIVYDILTQTVGTETPDGQAMMNAVNMGAVDSSFWDRMFYTMGRASNPMIGAMGKIIEDAQANRAKALREIDDRVRRLTNELWEKGFDTSFMYEPDGVHIISDIDWKEYYKQRRKYKYTLMKQGVSGTDLKEAMLEWEEQNTEERVVDPRPGIERTERVPNQGYRKEFPQLEEAQLKYYKEMMKIKGEIGTLLPEKYRKQYLAPQLRRNTVDAIIDSVKDANGRGILKAMVNKVKDVTTIRENDEDYGVINDMIDGEEFFRAESTSSNTPEREIPLYYMGKVEDGELLREFSTGLIHLAGSAINYSEMENIVEVVEFMGDFVKKKDPRSEILRGDVEENRFLKIVKDTFGFFKNNNTEAMIDGFISFHIYGRKRSNGNKWFNKLIDRGIQYTSFKNLATNWKGMVNNFLMGEFQMFVEAGAGEFYGFMNYARANAKLFGMGVPGEIMDLLTDNKLSKASLLSDLFDPSLEEFDSTMHHRFHKNIFRKLLSHDLSFMGYGAGEHLIHYVNMYAILDREKVELDGKKITLYDAFEVVNKQDGVAELKLKDGVTKDGKPVTEEYLDWVRSRIQYCNESCHGAMSKQKKGLIYQYWWGRMAMNFKQWMVEHYSRRFRGKHYDATLGEMREGYWVSLMHLLTTEKTEEAWEDKQIAKAFGFFIKDLILFSFRAQAQWNSLDKMQKHNVKRVRNELIGLAILILFNISLGEPDDHKGERARRFAMYQIKRLIMEEEASIPVDFRMPNSVINLLNSPMASINIWNAVTYLIYGLYNGDFSKRYKRGPHKGERKYTVNLKRNLAPFYRDLEQWRNMDTSDNIFNMFKLSFGKF